MRGVPSTALQAGHVALQGSQGSPAPTVGLGARTAVMSLSAAGRYIET